MKDDILRQCNSFEVYDFQLLYEGPSLNKDHTKVYYAKYICIFQIVKISVLRPTHLPN